MDPVPLYLAPMAGVTDLPFRLLAKERESQKIPRRRASQSHLDMDGGGELAKSLYESYTAIAASLFKAKTDEDIESLNTLYEALSELRDAWKIISSE